MFETPIGDSPYYFRTHEEYPGILICDGDGRTLLSLHAREDIKHLRELLDEHIEDMDIDPVQTENQP